MNVRDPKTLLLVSWGNNNGHMAHCVAVGKVAKDAGWRVVVACEEDPLHTELAARHGFEIVTFPPDPGEDRWLCWRERPYLRRAVDTDLRIISQVSPAAIVHDLRMSIPIAAQAAGVGCASICHQPLFVGFAHPGLPVNSLWTEGIDGFNDVISAVGWTPVRADLRELFTRTPMIVPSTPEFDPMTPEMSVGTTHYVGPLILPLDGSAGDPAAVVPDSLFFYRVVGGASFDEFKQAFEDLGDRVVIASGSERSADHLRAGSAGLGFRVEPLWNLTDVLPRTSVAIHHGGPGITLNCISAAVPAVGLPGNHPDRCLYSDALQSLGLGRSLSASASLGASWQSAVDTTGLMPSWREVRESIEGLAGDRELAQRLRHWSRRLEQRGSDDLLEVVERLPAAAA